MSSLSKKVLSSSTFQNSSDLDSRNESEVLPSVFPKQSFQRKQQSLLLSGPQGSNKSLNTPFWELSAPSRALLLTSLFLFTLLSKKELF